MFLAKVTDLDPDDPLGWLWRAGLAEEAEQALIWLNRALELDPLSPHARRALPRVRMQAAMAVAWGGDFVLASRLFQQAADADPDSVIPWLELAAMAETPEETRRCLNEVLRRDPNHVGARDCLARLDLERSILTGTPTPLSIETPKPPEAHDAAGETLLPPEIDAAAPGEQPGSGCDRLIPLDFDLPVDFGESTVITKGLPAPRRTTVMVVDDNDDVRAFVHRHLESLGLHVISAASADEADDLFAEHGVPDLILLDGIMPYVDGFEFCRSLRKQPETAKAPIVLLARKGGWLPREKGAMSGFNDTLDKPISPTSLRDMVAKYCPLLSEIERKPASWPELPEEIMR